MTRLYWNMGSTLKEEESALREATLPTGRRLAIQLMDNTQPASMLSVQYGSIAAARCVSMRNL